MRIIARRSALTVIIQAVRPRGSSAMASIVLVPQIELLREQEAAKSLGPEIALLVS